MTVSPFPAHPLRPRKRPMITHDHVHRTKVLPPCKNSEKRRIVTESTHVSPKYTSRPLEKCSMPVRTQWHRSLDGPEGTAGCSKRSLSHPPNPGTPRRAFPCAAAASDEARRTISPARPKLVETSSLLRGRYVEPLSDARTKLGTGRVLARLGKGGCNRAFFNILRRRHDIQGRSV